jgi:hypothetical protein
MADIVFTAAPTLAKFMQSNAFGRIIAGPIGSGKTTACIFELLRRAVQQKPAADGNRYTRFAIVRQTLKSLKDTVLKDCEMQFSTIGLGQWKVSESVFYLKFDNVISEWVFLPLEDASDQARLLSMQLTGAWMSEAAEMNFDIITPLSGRIGRYPAGVRGDATWHGIIGDTNMPTDMTPWAKFMQDPPPEWQCWVQPSGLAPEAENLSNLLQTEETKKFPDGDPIRVAKGRLYYDRLVSTWGPNHNWVKRYVKAEYGADPSGEAVFAETFRADFHIVPETLVIPGYPLLVGQDFGRNPWSLITQMDHTGRLLVHEEVPATNVGLEKHVNQNLRPRLMQAKYLGLKVAVICDPAGVAKSSHSEESSVDLLKRLGLAAYPAPTNDIDPRLRAVEALLTRQTNGGPTMLINRAGCPLLCRAMAGGYRFKKTKDGALKTVPEKNDPEGFSHIVDDLQYISLIVHGGLTDYVARHLWGRPKRARPKVTAAGWT